MGVGRTGPCTGGVRGPCAPRGMIAVVAFLMRLLELVTFLDVPLYLGRSLEVVGRGVSLVEAFDLRERSDEDVLRLRCVLERFRGSLLCISVIKYYVFP